MVAGLLLLMAGSACAAAPRIINETATASGEDPIWYAVPNVPEGRLAIKAVDNSGLVDGLLHGTSLNTMWLTDEINDVNNSGTVPGPAWLRIELPYVYNLESMWVWNHNQYTATGSGVARGMKDVTIEYSLTGGSASSDWATIASTRLTIAPGTEGYAHDDEISFGNVDAKYVVITADSGVDGHWGGINEDDCVVNPNYPCNVYGAKLYGLSEVRFFGRPHFARKPMPADKETETSANVVFSWATAPEAVAYDVYLGTDKAAIVGATRQSHPNVQYYSEANLSTDFKLSASLEPNTKYYWRVDTIKSSSRLVKNPDIWSFKVSPVVAWNPSPHAGKKNLGRILRWSRGCFSTESGGQDVYFGTNYNDVENATSSSSAYMGRQSDTSYDTTVLNQGKGLELGRTYYWRVDQVDSSKVWKGDIWSFTCCARRIIFNCDGCAVFESAKQKSDSTSRILDAWIRNMFDPLEDTGVDTFFWCDGGGGNNARYDSDVLERWGARIGKLDPVIEQLIAQGDDPPAVVVREAHRRGFDVFFSLRFNDVHDVFKDDKRPVLSYAAREFPTFKEQHPEWLIGKGHPYGYWSALNFAEPNVRDIKFETIKEIFQKYDFDGIEIDFKRSCPYFIPGTEARNAHIMTGLLRRIRRHLNERAKQRGRPIELAVRVDENLDACALDGFDVETWIKEDMVDIVIMGGGAGEIAIKEFKNLVEGTNVQIYACLDKGDFSYYGSRPTKLLRGLACNYWHQKADGIYTFNWFPHLPDRNISETTLLKEIGDPDVLSGKSMMFVVEHNRRLVQEIIDSGYYDISPQPYSWNRGVLPAWFTTHQTLKMPILVGRDLTIEPKPKSVELVIHCSELLDSDRINVLLNRKILSNSVRSNDVIRIHLEPKQVKLGTNEIIISAIKGKFKVNAVEIHVLY